MRALFVAKSLYPSAGGVERHVAGLQAALERRGHSIVLLEMGPTGKFVRAVRRTASILRSERIDVIHAHDFLAVFCAWIAMLFAGRWCPLHMTTHGYEGYPLKYHFIVAHRVAHRLAKSAISIGAYIDTWYGTKSSLVLHGGVENQGLAAKVRADRTMCFVSRLAPDTAALEVAQTFVKLSKRRDDCAFVVGGFGPSAGAVGKALEGSTVRYIGRVDIPETIFAQCTCVVANSYLAILEALSVGCVVIGFAQNALKVDYLNEIASACPAVRVARSLPELEAMLVAHLSATEEDINVCSKAAKTYAERMTWDNVARDYVALWSQGVP